MISTNCAYRIKQDGLTTLRTATKQSLPLNRLIIPNLRIGNLKSQVWFGFALQLAFKILLGIAFIDRFISGNFPSKQKAVPWHSRPVAITAKPKSPNTAQKAHNIADKPVSASYYNKTEAKSLYDVARAAKQIEQQPYTKHHVLASTHSYGLLTIKPIGLSRHDRLATRAVMKVSPEQPFYTLLSDVSNRNVRLPKRMITTQTTAPPHVLQALDCNAPPIETLKEYSNHTKSRISSSETNDNNPEEFLILHYKPAVESETQMSRQTLVQINDAKHLAQKWLDKV